MIKFGSYLYLSSAQQTKKRRIENVYARTVKSNGFE